MKDWFKYSFWTYKGWLITALIGNDLASPIRTVLHATGKGQCTYR